MPLKKSSSPEAFKGNLKAEMKAGKPQKQALAIAYSMKRKAQHKAHGGEVADKDMGCEACAMAEGGKCMSHGGMAENEGPKPDHSSHDVLPPMAPHQRMAEGGKVNAMKPLQQDPANENEELDEVGSMSNMPHPNDRGMLPQESSDMEEDLPTISKSLSLAAQIMEDRKRRMAEGGRVEADEHATGDGESMEVGSLDGPIDDPDMADLSNDSDELDAPVKDGRDSRGLDLEPAHTMEDDEHDESDASLVSQILKDRKMRRRG